MIQNAQKKEPSFKEQIGSTLRPALLGAALLLGYEREATAQEGKGPSVPALASQKEVPLNQRKADTLREKSKTQRPARSAAHKPNFTAEEVAARFKEAEKGSPDAMYDLGRALEFGQGVERNIQAAAPWYRSASEKGHNRAKCALADWLLRHEGEKAASAQEALSLFGAASKSGEPLATFRLAALHLHGFACERAPRKALELLELAVEQGCPDSPIDLARLLELGEDGVEPSLTKAIEVLEKAAPNGTPLVKHSLAEMYVQANRPKEAAPLLKEVIAAGVVEAAASLGDLYLAGNGVPKDVTQGIKLLRSSGAHNTPLGAFSLGAALLEPELGEGSRAEALQLLREAAKQDLTIAQSVLGKLLVADSSDPKHVTEGREWLRKSAAKGFMPSVAALGADLCASKSVVDQVEGVKILREGSLKGYAPCDLILGDALLLTEKSVEAEVYLKRAASKGLSDAKGILALETIKRSSLRNELPLANESAKEAAEAGSPIGFYAYALSRGPGVRTALEQRQHQQLWLEKAANAGHPGAQAHLGFLILESLDPQPQPRDTSRQQNKTKPRPVPPSLTKSAELTAAVKWLTLAGQSGVVQAQLKLQQLPLWAQQDEAAARAVKSFEPPPAVSSKEIDQFEQNAVESLLEDFKSTVKHPFRLNPELFTIMAKHSPPERVFECAEYLSDGLSGKRDLAGSNQLLIAAAQRGHLPAQSLLAARCSAGSDGIIKDQKVAASWAEVAATAGDAQGQYLYGLLLTNGEGGLQSNPTLGAEMLSKAAGQGHAQAAWLLASRKEAPSLTTYTNEQRLEHLRIASSAGIQAAHLALLDTLLAKDSSETSVSAEARKVISLLEVQDRGMHTLARGLLARLDKDYDAAAKLLSTEAARDSEYANLALGMMHDDTLIPENRSTLSKLKALRLYEAAANLGSIEALTRMGLLCERGLSDSGDYKLAVAYHRKAAEKGSHRSNYRLGVLLSEGSESSVTIPEAHARLSIAAAQGHETAKKKLEALENKLTKEQRLESSKLVQQIGLERFKRPTTSGIGRLVYTADTEGR